jgi:hypothetical protein
VTPYDFYLNLWAVFEGTSAPTRSLHGNRFTGATEKALSKFSQVRQDLGRPVRYALNHAIEKPAEVNPKILELARDWLDATIGLEKALADRELCRQEKRSVIFSAELTSKRSSLETTISQFERSREQHLAQQRSFTVVEQTYPPRPNPFDSRPDPSSPPGTPVPAGPRVPAVVPPPRQIPAPPAFQTQATASASWMPPPSGPPLHLPPARVSAEDTQAQHRQLAPETEGAGGSDLPGRPVTGSPGQPLNRESPRSRKSWVPTRSGR